MSYIKLGALLCCALITTDWTLTLTGKALRIWREHRRERTPQDTSGTPQPGKPHGN